MLLSALALAGGMTVSEPFNATKCAADHRSSLFTAPQARTQHLQAEPVWPPTTESDRPLLVLPSRSSRRASRLKCVCFLPLFALCAVRVLTCSRLGCGCRKLCRKRGFVHLPSVTATSSASSARQFNSAPTVPFASTFSLAISALSSVLSQAALLAERSPRQAIPTFWGMPDPPRLSTLRAKTTSLWLSLCR